MNNIFIKLFLYPIGTLFLSLVGISLVLSYKANNMNHNQKPSFLKYLKRGLFLFSIALMITTLTWIYPHDGFIVFGVIHCIAISIILSYWLIPRPNIAFLLGSIVIVIGIFFTTFTIDNPFLFWIGLTSPSFYTLDYFPLFPWLGVVLIGTVLGHQIYPILEKKYLKKQIQPTLAKPFSYLGRHALIIYLIHQPILFGLLCIISPII
jgi:uncharacterized membrane protein